MKVPRELSNRTAKASWASGGNSTLMKGEVLMSQHSLSFIVNPDPEEKKEQHLNQESMGEQKGEAEAVKHLNYNKKERGKKRRSPTKDRPEGRRNIRYLIESEGSSAVVLEREEVLRP